MRLIHKLILGFWTVVLLSSITGYFAINNSRKVLQKAFIENCEYLVAEILYGINREIEKKVEIFQSFTHDSILQETVLKTNQDFKKLDDIQAYIIKKDKEWTSAPKKELTPFIQNLMNNKLSRELRKKMKFFKEYHGYKVFGEIFVTNKYGANVAITGKTSDYRQDDEEWWQSAKRDGLYIEDVEYDESADVYSIDIGLRIDDESNNFIGAMKLALNIDDIINFIKEVQFFGIHQDHETMKFKIVTKEGKLIYSTVGDFKFLENVSYLLPEIHLSPEPGHSRLLVLENKGEGRNEIYIFRAHSKALKNFKGKGLDWILVVEHEAKELFAPVTKLKNKILTISLVVIIASMFLGFFISKYISNNFKKLKDAAVKIGKGNLDTWIDVKSNDEIGQLAEAFQKMTEDLRKTTVSRDKLTKEVAERKRAEETIQIQLKRFNVLQFINMTITASLDLQVTLDILIIQITAQLGIDAVAVLLINQHTQTLEYVASKGFRTGALKYTKLRLGDSNAGRAAIEQCIVVIPDLKQKPDGFTRSKLFASEDFITYFAVPLIAKGQVKGVMELFHRAPLGSEQDWLEFFENVANQAAIAIDNATLFNELHHSNIELTSAYDTTIEGWSRAMDLRDKETEGHTQRVAEMTLSIACELGVKDEELVHIRRGALLHDMGKMGIPDSILLKPGPLTEEEWKIMKKHPVYAHQMLYPIDYLRPALDIPYCHHEKWDGSGYPRGLVGKEIPLSARIFAVVDVWDALISDRPYRPAWPEEKVLEYIRSNVGIHFDPEVVKVFLETAWNMNKTVDILSERIRAGLT